VVRLGLLVIASAFAGATVGTAAATTHGVSPGSFVRASAVPLGHNVGCTAEATKALVHRFVGDLNTGRLTAIDRLWAPAPRFQWFSTPSRSGNASKDRATLISYIRTRVREHERILLTVLGAGYDPRRHDVDFGGKLIRSANDMAPELVRGPRGLRPIRRPFKGAADCVSGKPLLIVWSM
jgi:hypothetical protein